MEVINMNENIDTESDFDFDLENNFPISKRRHSKNDKSLKQELDEWDDEEGFQKAKRKGKMRDIEDRQERKRLYQDIAWFQADD